MKRKYKECKGKRRKIIVKKGPVMYYWGPKRRAKRMGQEQLEEMTKNFKKN